MRLRYLALLLAFVAGGIFLLSIHAAERATDRQHHEHMDNYGRFLSLPLWNMNGETCKEYLSLIMELEPYRWFRILDEEGAEYLRVDNEEPEGRMDRILRSLKLVRDVPYSVEVLYEGKPIGAIASERTNRNIYFYIGLAPFLATVSIFIFASQWLRKLRERDQQNTLRLAREKVKRLESQQDLEAAQQRYKQLIDSATDIIYECDLKGRFQTINPTAGAMLGFNQEDLIGKHFSGLVHPDYRKELIHLYITQAQERRKNTYMEFPITDKDGNERWLGQNVQLVFDKGEPVGFQAVARDITELKKAMDELADRDARMREEFRVAQTIHQALMPISVPKLHGFEFGLRFVPSGVLGGDFINFIEYPDNTRLGVVFADITGHGVAAALLSSMFKVLVDEVMHSGSSPASCFNMLNRRLAAEFPEGNYVSAFFAIFDRRNRSMTYVKASQEPVYLIRPGEPARILDEGGPALGLLDPFTFGEPGYEQFTVQLMAGDMVYFYTDGLIELWNDKDEMLEREELTAWLEETRDLTPQDLVDEFYHRAVRFAGTSDLPDDVAELAVRVEGS